MSLQWHKAVSAEVNRLAAIFVMLAGFCILALFWIEESSHSQLNKASEYHLASAVLASRSITEIDALFTASVGRADGRQSELTGGPGARLSAHFLVRHINALAALQEAYGNSEFDDLIRRLNDLIPRLNRLTRQTGIYRTLPPVELLPNLDTAKTVLHQLARLHSIAHNNVMADWNVNAEQKTIATVCVILVIGILAFLMFLRVRGSIRQIVGRQFEAEHRINEALVNAEEANQTKSDFLATMSHELRTPLNAIMGFSQMIMVKTDGPIGSEKYEEYVSDILKSSEMLLGHVDDILHLSVLEAGKEIIEFDSVDLRDLTKEALRSFTILANEKDIRLRSEFGNDDMYFEGDRRAVTQVIFNVLSNAVKYTQRGGEVAISTSSEDCAVNFRATDTGIGIDAEIIDRITEPFLRGHVDPLTTRDGIGLGLSIVSSLVRAHNGELVIESEPGEGTTVVISFPKWQKNGH